MPIKHLRSPALVSALVFAAGGVGFAIGNLLLARVLPAEEFGAVALILAVTQLGITLGPLGLSTLINRHHLLPSGELLTRALSSSVVIATGLAAGAVVLYDMSVQLAVILAVTVLAAAVNHVGGAFFQSSRRFGISLFLLLIHNWVVLLAVPVVLLLGSSSALPVVLTIAAGYLVTAVMGWWSGMRTFPSPAAPHLSKRMVQEGLATVGATLALGVMFQLDRLLIPRALTLSDLATYSVVSAVAASPFRMLQVGASYTLLPRLRGASTRAAILSLLQREAAVVLSIAALATVVVLALTPWVVTELLAGRYVFQPGLLYAMVLTGFVRVANGFATSAVMALGSPRQLFWLNGWSWIALVVGGVLAFAAAGAGLIGIVYGIGAGWLTLALAAAVLAGRAIASRPDSSAPR